MRKIDLDTTENRKALSELLSMTAVIFIFVSRKEKKIFSFCRNEHMIASQKQTYIKVIKLSFLGKVHTIALQRAKQAPGKLVHKITQRELYRAFLKIM